MFSGADMLQKVTQISPNMDIFRQAFRQGMGENR